MASSYYTVLVGHDGQVDPVIYRSKDRALEACAGQPYYLIKEFCTAIDANEALVEYRPSVPSRKVVTIYADGACSSNGTSSASAGVGVFWGVDDPRNVSRPVHGSPTNNVAELEAIEEAAKQIWKQLTPCALHGYEYRIVTDSQYCISALTQWFDTWEKRGWKTATGGPVKNVDLIRRIHDQLELLADFVKLVHVRGHVGIPGNEAADVLAKAGAAVSSRVRNPK